MSQISLKPAPAPAPRDGALRFLGLGLGVVVLLFGGIAAWSLSAPIQSAAIAPGTVAVETNRKAIQHLEGGIVGAIHVRDGDTVRAGDLLLTLDDTLTRAQLGVIEGRYFENLTRRARLHAERDDASGVALPVEVLRRAWDPAIPDIVEGERRLFEARRDSREAEIRLLRQRIQQLRDQIVGQEAQRDARTRQLEIVSSELSDVRSLVDRGHATRTRLLALEREEAELLGERGMTIAAIAEAKTAIGEAELRIVSLTKGHREQVLSELRVVNAELAELTEERVAALDTLSRTEIRSPHEGRVIAMQAHTIGGVIGPGQPILHIVPKDDPLVIAARVRPEDVDAVERGGSARVRFPSFDARTTPELDATVEDVSADALTAEDGSTYYLAKLRLTEAAEAQAPALQPGMPAETFITTNEQTLATYLVKPLTDAFAHAFRN